MYNSYFQDRITKLNTLVDCSKVMDEVANLQVYLKLSSSSFLDTETIFDLLAGDEGNYDSVDVLENISEDYDYNWEVDEIETIIDKIRSISETLKGVLSDFEEKTGIRIGIICCNENGAYPSGYFHVDMCNVIDLINKYKTNESLLK